MASKTINAQQLTDEMASFGGRLAGADCSHLSGDQLHELLGSTAGLESQIAVFRANLLLQIDRLGGDPIDSQKRNGKSSHSASKKNAETAKALEKLPNVKTKMSQGAGMSANKASLLAVAAKKTTAEDVDGDDTLLQRVTNQGEDQAKQTIETWVRNRQSNGERKTQRQKKIDERQFWMFAKDGMVHTHGRRPADARNMARFRRWETEKTRLWRLDGGRESAHRSVRSDEQRGADAYDNIEDGIDGIQGGLRDQADWCADVENRPIPDPPVAPEAQATPTAGPPPPAPAPAPTRPSRTQIVVVERAQHLDSDDPDHLADIIGGGPLLRSELERLKCNAELYGVLFDAHGENPLWAGRAVRACTDSQWRALLVRDGACVLTGADATHCEAHHILPFEAPAKGRSDITNLVMVSVSVHHWLHDNELTIFRKPDGSWETRPAEPHEIAPRGRRAKAA